jgi:hypothetical protein
VSQEAPVAETINEPARAFFTSPRLFALLASLGAVLGAGCGAASGSDVNMAGTIGTGFGLAVAVVLRLTDAVAERIRSGAAASVAAGVNARFDELRAQLAPVGELVGAVQELRLVVARLAGHVLVAEPGELRAETPPTADELRAMRAANGG